MLALLGALACERQADSLSAPTGPSRSSAIASDSSFYYYQGRPIPLDIDPTQIVVESQVKNLAPIANALLVGVGASVSDSIALPQAANHRILLVRGGSEQHLGSVIKALRADARFSFVSAVYNTRAGHHRMLPLNRVMLRLKVGATAAQVDSINKVLGTRTISPPVPDSGYLSWRLAYPRGADPLRIAQQLDRSTIAEWADPDVISDPTPSYVPTDPYYALQFHLKNATTFNGVRVDINVEPAWDLTLGSHAIRVTVIDDGQDILHGNTGGGYNGDLVGPFGGAQSYDLLNDPSRPGENAFYPCCNDTHGTSVSGIIAATHSNSTGGVGIAPNVTLSIARIFRQTYPPQSLSRTAADDASNAQIGAAINWAWQAISSDVINNSWGGGALSNEITGAVNAALTQGRGGLGTVVVFAAGNTADRPNGNVGVVQYPASLSASSAVISVGAINRFGQPANYTPDGQIDIVAPSGMNTGECLGEIITTDRYGPTGCNDGPNGDINYTTSFSGTSAATPQVSAVAALMLSYKPYLTSTAIKANIRSSADNWGTSTTYGAGKLNAYQALLR